MPSRLWSLTILSFLPVGLASISLAQTQPLEVAYLWTSTSVLTYNFDRQTGIPSFQGQMTPPILLASVKPSPDGRFLYFFGEAAGSNQLLVYSTAIDGQPQSAPIQKMILNSPNVFDLDPTGRFAYAPAVEPKYQGRDLILFTIDPQTGMVQAPEIVARYPFNGPCPAGQYGTGPYVIGFNSAGTVLYEQWICGSDAGVGFGNYLLQIDQQTGEIVGSSPTVGASGDGEQGTVAHLAQDAFFSFAYSGAAGRNSVAVFPPTGGLKAPTFTCTKEMLEACGFAASIVPDPSGQNIFFQIEPGNVQVAHVELDENKIVSTPYHMADGVLAFSPDEALLYAQPNPDSFTPPFVIDICLFNPATGAISHNPDASITNLETGYGFNTALRSP
jgi:hypothetical protein